MGAILRIRPTWVGVALLLFHVSLASADHVPQALDVDKLRPAMPDEGFLIYATNPIVGRAGEEFSGWVDIRHPSTAGANDLTLGYDRSDHSVTVNSTILDDGTALNPTPATPNRSRDFDFANRQWAQGGLTVLESFQGTYVSGAGPQNVNLVSTSAAGRSIIRAGLKSPVGTIDLYYSRFLDNQANTAFRGVANGSSVANAGIFVATQGSDTASPDTFGHELGHFLLDGPSVDNPGAGGHSNTNTNLMASGSIRYLPGMAKDAFAANNPPWNIANSITVVGPAMSTNPDGSPKVGGINQLTGGGGGTSQLERVFDNVGNTSTTQYVTHNDNLGAANRVDWDFVVDQGSLEGVTGGFGDNHGTGRDRLYFRTRIESVAIPESSQVGKLKTGLGTFDHENDFVEGDSENPNTFRTADVFSIASRYADWDVDSNGDSTIRERALDYKVVFRDEDGIEHDGELVRVWTKGWTENSNADDYIGRWVSPVDAVELFIQGISTDGHDFSAQIDAVIVSASVVVPEPNAVIMLALCGLMFAWRRRS